MQWQMVKIIGLGIVLIACTPTNTLKPVTGEEVPAPYGWKYTYCPEHPNEVGCK